MKNPALNAHRLRSKSSRRLAAGAGTSSLLIVAALAACGSSPAAPDAGHDTDGQQPGIGLRVRTVSTLEPQNMRGIALAALDEHHVAIVRSNEAGEAFCPDCVDLDPSQCPA